MAEQKRSVFTGRIVEVTLEPVRLPNGCETEFEIVHHPGGAAVVALDAQRRVCLLHQYRHAVDDWLWELPAGKRDHGEAPQSTARRELQEEAGVHAARWHSLGHMISSPGVFTEVVYLYLARELEFGATAVEAHEVFERHWLDFDEAIGKAERGEFNDAKTVIGLLRARAVLVSGAEER